MKTTYAEVWVTLEKPAGGRMMKQFFCASRADAIAKVIMKVSKLIEEQPKEKAQREEAAKLPPQPVKNPVIPATAGEIHACPECGSVVEHEGGCVICRNCGFSKCG